MKALVLGGVKSGKSKHAETLAMDISSSVTLIATATALDDEMKARIQRHKDDRPEGWNTIEAPIHLADTLDKLNDKDVVVIDCLTLWLTNLLCQENNALMELEITKFEEAVKHFSQPLILVSNETNMGIMPMGDLTRQYCDRAGELHKNLAKLCSRVELIVAGLPLPLKHEIMV